jgi:hypothetical protein
MVFAPSLWQDWKHRPAPKECISATVKMAGTQFKLPLLGFISFDVGQGEQYTTQPNNLDNMYYLFAPSSYKKFCDAFKNGQRTVNANYVSIDFNRMPRYIKVANN